MITFEAAVTQLKQVCGITVVGSAEPHRYALLSGQPLKIRARQQALSVDDVQALGEAALLLNQLRMLVAELEAASQRAAAAVDRMGTIKEFYSAEFVRDAQTSTTAARETMLNTTATVNGALSAAVEWRTRVECLIDAVTEESAVESGEVAK